MSCSGLLVGLLLAWPGSAARVWGGCRSRAGSRAAVDRGARGGRAERAWPSNWPAKGIRSRRGRCARGFPGRLEPDGPTRFDAAARVVGSPAEQASEPWRARLDRDPDPIGRASSSSWPSGRPSPSPPRTRWPSMCLRAVLERQPDHREARRLLGYVPHEGGWARPFAVAAAQEGLREPPDLRLGAGRLGAAPRPWRAARAAVAGPEEDPLAPRRRGRPPPSDWNPPWRIYTEHFEIQTNVPLAEAISFGRRLEAFHDLFMALWPTSSARTCRWSAASRTRR